MFAWFTVRVFHALLSVYFNGSNPDDMFILPDLIMLLGSYVPINESSVVKFLYLCFHVLSFSILATGGH